MKMLSNMKMKTSQRLGCLSKPPGSIALYNYGASASSMENRSQPPSPPQLYKFHYTFSDAVNPRTLESLSRPERSEIEALYRLSLSI